jgi:nucleoside-diphosphate-sugar epimerase
MPTTTHLDRALPTVAVVGATGLVGSALTRRLQATPSVRVVALARNAIGAGIIDAGCPDCEIRIGSVTDGVAADELLGDCNVVINCALADGGGIPRLAYTRNARIIDGIVRAPKLQMLVHLSSVAVYGEYIRSAAKQDLAFRRPRPDSEYGRSKLYAERYAARHCRRSRVACSILRLGHVYGAGTARSRHVLELARDPRFRLPFGGAIPSNAIHLDALCSTVELLATGTLSEGVFNLAGDDVSWRDVFDWHTASVGLDAVAPMSIEASEQLRAGFERSSLIGDVLRWGTSLPLRGLMRSPAVFDAALRLLVRTPQPLVEKVLHRNRRLESGRHIAALAGAEAPAVEPLYLSRGMPGPSLELPDSCRDVHGSAHAREELARWHRRWSTPPTATRDDHRRQRQTRA